MTIREEIERRHAQDVRALPDWCESDPGPESAERCVRVAHEANAPTGQPINAGGLGDATRGLVMPRRMLRHSVRVARGELAPPRGDANESCYLCAGILDQARRLRDQARRVEAALPAHLRLEVEKEIAEAVAVAAERRDTVSETAAGSGPQKGQGLYDPLPTCEGSGSIAGACRAVILGWVSPKGAIPDDYGREDEERAIVIALAFGKPDLLPRGVADTRSAWRRMRYAHRCVVDAAARAFWLGGGIDDPTDDEPMTTSRPFQGDAALDENAPEAAACREVLAGAAPARAARKAGPRAALVIGLAFGRADLLPEPGMSFRSVWRTLDRRERRLVDAAARAAWPARSEPLVEGWW
ncbi:hypothetical protein [Rubrimonas cliftonensis]|uniref:Uncharacterized protein n=1 Tax=Rubrimonas cliftonensis TaxID=89524 RepID=A0A1H4FYF2_9RHOB|nr:hypothetical protein [Rubrimonas cliftonensis]SEB02373.1 hypothetical protein SAMN05444370_13127 [Rubrimonas cliftonensis]